MPGPFQQTSRSLYQDFHKALSPTALLQPNGAAFEAGQGSVKDALFDRCLQAVKARYPNLAPADALAIVGADRSTPRGPGESDSAYAARLLNAWNVWPWAGTAYGLLQAFWSTGYKNVVLAQVRGGKQFTLDQGGANLLTWSSDLSNAAWVKTFSGTGVAPTVTRNFGAAPDGTTTAARVQFNQGAGVTSNDWSMVGQSTSSPSGVAYAQGVYLKTNDGSNKTILLYDDTNGLLLLCAVTPAWQFFSLAGTAGAGAPRLKLWVRSNSGTSGPTADILVAYPRLMAGLDASTYAQTYGLAISTSIGAGSLLTSTMASGIWETDVLSSLSPANQAFWSKFDVLFPLPLMPLNWTWSGGIPSSSSAESNFIRALIQAWKPAHATCNRIVIVQQGLEWGYPASQVWGASNGLWGGTANTVWTP